MRRIFRTNIVVWMAAMLMLMVMYGAACDDFVKTSYQTLSVSKQTYDTTLSVMGDLYKQGKLTEVQKDKAIELGWIYKEAHNMAVLALVVYDASNNSADKGAFEAAIAESAKRLTEFLTFVQPLLKGGV